MNKTEASARIDKLKELINKYRYSRLVLDKLLVEEHIEDSLKKELFDLEQQYPDLVTPDSPTQRVGGQPLDKFEKFTHPARMLSFNDAFNPEDMNDWVARMERIESNAVKSGFYCELKIDGLAIELIYRDRLLSVGSTRGDGFVGENVTQNIKTIEAVPLSLNGDEEILDELKKSKRSHLIKYFEDNGLPSEIVVRGEVFIGLEMFKKVNEEQKKAGEVTYANPRNLAAGSLRQLDSSITANRKLNSFAYSLVTDMGQQVHEDEHIILHALGFKTNSHNKFCKNIEEVNDFRNKWEVERDGLDYEIDGVVVLVNDNSIFDGLGIVGKAPRAGIAYKFAPKQATTIVEDIFVSVGRTGALTPIAMLKPVEIGGTTVSRATLHNEDEITRLGLKIGDTVVVGRAGDVIPDIISVLPELRTGKEKFFKFPSKCPVCNEAVERKDGESAYKCVNNDCPAQRREAIYHFVSKAGVNMDGLGPKIIDQLMDVGLIADSADLYKIKKEDLLNLDRFADKSADNLISTIDDHRKISLDRFIYSLGIPNVGSETARDLAKNFKTLEKIKEASIEDLNAIENIGDVVAEAIFGWFNKKANQKLLEKFEKVGVQVLVFKESNIPQKLAGMTFVLTGTLPTLSREEAEELIRKFGGEVSSSVSKKTSYVLAGDNPGSKIDKARDLGIKIISEADFISMVA